MIFNVKFILLPEKIWGLWKVFLGFTNIIDTRIKYYNK